MRTRFVFSIALGVGSFAAPLLAQGPGGGRGGFPQYTRPLAPQDVILRGKALYETNCADCHAADLRGVPAKHGPNLLRSTETFSDQRGELIAASLLKHDSPMKLSDADTLAVSEYIHSIQATMGGQGSPPGRNPVGLTYDVLVGDAKRGEGTFAKLCASCHSVTGDLKGIGAKYDDPKTLQATWVAGRAGGFGFGRGGGGQQATVTLANGQKLEGRLVRKDDFLVVLILADGTRRSITRDNGIPRVDVKDPQEAHKKMILVMDDPDNRNLHDITAYLATIK